MANDVPTIRADYDRLADEYARHLADELDHKPFDRELLARFAERTRGGTVCDLGCGPGHVARFLRDHGADVFGVDLSPQMIARARELVPDVPFREGNMLELDLAPGSLRGAVLFYAIVNLSDDDIARAFTELARVLAPGGLALVAFHLGDERLQPGELWGVPVAMDFFLLDQVRIRMHLEAAGLVVEEALDRDPYPDVEYPSRRAYLFAKRPG